MARKYDNSPFYVKLKGEYLCSHCGRPHGYAAAAYNCHRSKKPVSRAVLDALLTILHKPLHPHNPTPRTHAPGDGVTHPDKHGHWYRGNNHEKRLTADYHHAIFNLKFQLTQEDCLRLNKLFPEWSDEEEIRRMTNPHSPMQKIAFAFHTGNWGAIRNQIQNIVSDSPSAPDKELVCPFKLIARNLIEQAESKYTEVELAEMLRI